MFKHESKILYLTIYFLLDGYSKLAIDILGVIFRNIWVLRTHAIWKISTEKLSEISSKKRRVKESLSPSRGVVICIITLIHTWKIIRREHSIMLCCEIRGLGHYPLIRNLRYSSAFLNYGTFSILGNARFK